MSFVDLVGILLTISLGYIGYAKGLKGKLFFITSFFASAFLMYFSFEYVLEAFSKTFKSTLIAGIIISILIIMPMFLLIELGVKKLFSEDSKSFSVNKNKITNSSRVVGAIIGMISGYIFMFYFTSVTHDVPIEKSFFHKTQKSEQTTNQEVEPENPS